MSRSPLDRVYCPACCVPVACQGVAGGWVMQCPTCGYYGASTGKAPTLRRLLAGAEAGTLWPDVDLARWSRLVVEVTR